jgi:hypothetical protein
LISVFLRFNGGCFMESSFTPRSHTRTAADVARKIEGFLEGRCGPQDWSEFCTFRIADPELDAIRQHCARLPEEFPSASPERYCGAGGYAVLRGYIRMLRDPDKAAATAPRTSGPPRGTNSPRAVKPPARSADPKDAVKVTGSGKDWSVSVGSVVERENASPPGGFAGAVYQGASQRPAVYPEDLPFVPNLEVRVIENVTGRVLQWQAEPVEVVREAVLRACLEEGWERVLRPAVPEMVQKLMSLVLLRRGDRWRFVTGTVLKAGSFVKLIDVPAGTPWKTALEIH